MSYGSMRQPSYVKSEVQNKRLLQYCPTYREVISDVFYSSSKVRSYYSPPMDVDALTEAALKV